jgi:hypothetical protein
MWISNGNYEVNLQKLLSTEKLVSAPLILPMRIYTFIGTLMGLFPMANVLSGKPSFRAVSFGTLMTVANMAYVIAILVKLFCNNSNSAATSIISQQGKNDKNDSKLCMHFKWKNILVRILVPYVLSLAVEPSAMPNFFDQTLHIIDSGFWKLWRHVSKWRNMDFVSYKF